MSRVDSITPAGPITLAPGESQTFDVLVSGVPGDDTTVYRSTGSDGSAVTISIVTDRAALEGILTGTPQVHQVLGEVASGPGSVQSVGPITGGWRFKFTAA